MSETWHGDSYVEEQESLANSVASMTSDVQSAKLVSNKVVTEDLYLYISPTGNDTTGDGTQGKPFFSLNRCCEYVNSRITAIADGGIVFVICAPGVYDYSQVEQNVSICKAGLKIQIKGQAITDDTTIYNKLLTKINNSEDPVYTFTSDGIVVADGEETIVHVQYEEGGDTYVHALSSNSGEFEVHAGYTLRVYDNTRFINNPSTVAFYSKRTTFNVGDNLLWVTGRNTRCDLLNLKVVGSSYYAIGLQEIYCNQFKCIETVGGIQVSKTQINLLQECTIDCTNNGSGFAINNRSDVKLNQGAKRPTLLVIGSGISVSKFSTFDTSNSYVTVRNADVGLSVGSCSIASCRLDDMMQKFTFENCNTNTFPSTLNAWSSNMGYIS